ncbi:dTDP-4-dehydrorhamnose reductase [Synechococcus sp. A15-60]|uniref:dTDP-4-dehydrorhamnose reductase n=1 Tax=Synechococcus sp. A15-60 TaxID=1050655 RepID=UPI0016456C66|nr:dTDP-4-dehydrorhamnose reductase [Synechococcus sp. A15-60]QNI46808.1 dTDP-4-dehydrorhamnose reductase [Synechococcus sp. A15-60]
MKVLLTGAGGQLGQALCDSVPSGLELIATGRQQLDLADAQACRAAVAQHRPDWVLNAGAYTAVDKAESEPKLAQAVNAGAPRAFAEALAEHGGRLLQVSTDFVFNGQQGHPYYPDQLRQPLGVYGASKAAGEEAVAAVLGCGDSGVATILRTSWAYGPVGRNFLLTMLRLHRLKAEAGEPLSVVADQVGCPTSTLGLAQACWAVIQQQVAGIHHWSDAGAASWYDFAVAIGELASAHGLIAKAAQVRPIMAAQYPTPAQRPAYSLLDCAATRQQLHLQPQHWRVALEEVIHHVDA